MNSFLRDALSDYGVITNSSDDLIFFRRKITRTRGKRNKVMPSGL